MSTVYRPLLDILTRGRTLPEGFDAWGMRAVNPDFTSSHGYRWPWPGRLAVAPGPILNHRGSCPQQVGDGICTATTAAGMASGGIPAVTVLLTAHRGADVIGDDTPGKLRLREALVVDAVVLGGFDLAGANLEGASLALANLEGANLARANLAGASLALANLARANLARANLIDASLVGANLARANLARASLVGANLAGANLAGANLEGANLIDASLYGAIGLADAEHRRNHAGSSFVNLDRGQR